MLHCRNYCNSEMTTCDVQLGAVHVLGLGLSASIATVNKINPRERMLLASTSMYK